MKTPLVSLKKMTIALFALRFVLLTVILVFTVSIGQSQTNVSPANNKSSNNKVVENPLKKWAHAPDPNAPDFEEKKQEWKRNYPEEYGAYLKEFRNPNLNQNVVKPNTTVQSGSNCSGNKYQNPGSKYPNKVAEHAPDLDDPEYEIKKAEWIKKYPEEYRQLGPASAEPQKE